ncbi:AAA family ATPase [Streptomyces sp. NPDC020801]|uniref:AAA family ATPase n=1 Tax=unclassified Streptomyces TaxID=2593676 RepID=UPI0037B750A4
MTPGNDGSLGWQLITARDRAFVGRTAERALFRAALAGEPGACPVLYLHGPGGIGKSTLLRRFAQMARESGRRVVEVDGRTVSPTPEGFTEAAGKAVSEPETVLLVDTFERCRGLEGWLWEQFLPRLPLGAVSVVAGREAPDPGWICDPGWADVLHFRALRNLSPDDALVFLRIRGVPATAHHALLSFAGGNPLALALAATVAVRDVCKMPELPQDWLPGQDVTATLIPRLVGYPPSPEHRKALEICAHAYVTSEALLRALLGDCAPELFAWLRAQPYIESTPSGLFPHDVVRETLVADLRWRDSDGFTALHKQMHQYLFEQLRTAPAAQILPATGALLYLYRNDGHTAHFHDWRNAGLVYDQPCVAADEARVLELIEEAEGSESAEIARYWLDRQPAAFRVYLSAQTDDIIACSAWLQLNEPQGEEVDPVVAAAWAHARANEPLRAGEHLAVARFNVHPPKYQRPSPPLTLTQWRAMGEIFRADRLAWSFLVTRHDGYWDDHLAHYDMFPTGITPTVGEHPYRLFAHDWRAQPVIPWLMAKTDATLTGIAPGVDTIFGVPGQEMPRQQSELVVLSRPEFDTAVRDALRALRRPDALAENPLNRCRLVVENGGILIDVLTRAIEALPQERGGDKRHRAITTAYLGAVPTQEAAAERLGLPFSTFRRHLTSAVTRVSDALWRHELSGARVYK